MEEKIQVKTKDGCIVYGNLNYKKKNDTLLIFVHGLTGSAREHQYFNAVPYFANRGYDIFRFDFYSRKKNGRQLSDCSISTHISDLNLVIDKFKDKYKKVVLIGHSLGALVVLGSKLDNIYKLILWDPTIGLKSLKKKKCVFLPEINKYLLRWGRETLISEKMVEEWKIASDLEKLVKKITKPCKFIFADTHKSSDVWGPYLKDIKVENDSVIIKGASHIFCEEGIEEKLFSETLSWLEK